MSIPNVFVSCSLIKVQVNKNNSFVLVAMGFATPLQSLFLGTLYSSKFTINTRKTLTAKSMTPLSRCCGVFFPGHSLNKYLLSRRFCNFSENL